MKILIAILMMFLIVSCSSAETTFKDEIREYELRIMSLEKQTKDMQKQINLNKNSISKKSNSNHRHYSLE